MSLPISCDLHTQEIFQDSLVLKVKPFTYCLKQLVLELDIRGDTNHIINIEKENDKLTPYLTPEGTLVTPKLSELERAVIEKPLLNTMEPIPSSINHTIEIFLQMHALLHSILHHLVAMGEPCMHVFVGSASL